MNYSNRCLFCLEAIANDASECPRCGKKGVPAVKYSDALVPGTILSARYLLGEVVERSDYLVRYKALDCADNEKVFVDEFFPRSMATRRPGESVLEIDPVSKMLVERAKKAWLNSDAKAAIQENSTVYLVFSEVRERTPDEERTVMQSRSVEKKVRFKITGRKALGVTLICFGLAAIITGIMMFPKPLPPEPPIPASPSTQVLDETQEAAEETPPTTENTIGQTDSQPEETVALTGETDPGMNEESLPLPDPSPEISVEENPTEEDETAATAVTVDISGNGQ